jgi:chromate transport protein ChrA
VVSSHFRALLQVMESTSAAAGTAVVAFILTAILPTTLEDILALLLAGAIAYISLLSWPIKRGDIKSALSERFANLAASLETELKAELDTGVNKLRKQVKTMVAPLLETAQQDLATVLSRQQQLEV